MKMHPNSKHLSVSERDGIIQICLNRPQQRNALNGELLDELIQLFKWVNKNEKIRLLTLQGNGPVFCGGADLNWFSERNKLSESELVRDTELFYDCYDLLYNLFIPSLCFVHGAVYGGANGLVAASDICIAAPGTKFSFSEVKLGLVAATILPFVTRKIGTQASKELMMTGRVFESREALRIRLIDYSCEESSADACLDEWISYFKQAAPSAVKETRKLIHKLNSNLTGTDQRKMTTELMAALRKSPEAREGMAAFFEKRPPDWQI